MGFEKFFMKKIIELTYPQNAAERMHYGIGFEKTRDWEKLIPE